MNRSDILAKIDNPKELERLYQQNKTAFKAEFRLIYPELTNHQLADYWKERLNYEAAEISWGSKKEWILVIILSLSAGLIAKLPEILNILPEPFYQRNIGLIVFPALTIYFILSHQLSRSKLAWAGGIFLVSALFINLLPASANSDSLILSCIHLPLFLWAVLGFFYAGDDYRSYPVRLGFLRYNGDLVIMGTLILIAGIILTAITIGLFKLIGFKIEEFYTEYVLVFGAAALPIVSTFITQTNPQLVNRISPVIARIFSPLVLITLVAYLTAILFSGKNPYDDRP